MGEARPSELPATPPSFCIGTDSAWLSPLYSTKLPSCDFETILCSVFCLYSGKENGGGGGGGWSHFP